MVLKNFNYIQQDFIVPSPNDPDFVVKLTQYLRDIAKELRYKQTIIQSTEEQIIGQEGVSTIFGKSIDFGALPNGSTKCVPHGLNVTPAFRWRRISAIAQKDDGTGLQINSGGAGGNNWINIYTTATDVCIETGSDRSDFTLTKIFLEYIKNI